MKILLTGCTASHVSAKKNLLSPTFTGLIHKALTHGRHDVTWIEPSVSLSKEYLEEFDSVVVGLAPPNSTAAHRIYGALSVIQYAHELGTLRLVIDAPEPKRVWAGIRAIKQRPEELTKEFYSKRREYRKVSDDGTLDRLHAAVDTLFTQEWPNTVYPTFPWMSYPSVSTEIPMASPKNLIGLNFDSDVVSLQSGYSASYSDYWVVDASNTKWTKQIEQTVKSRVIPARISRWEENSEVISRMSGAIGCLVSVYKHANPWWSIALAQSLSNNVPVVTDWRLSSMLGESWSVLAQSVEEMSWPDRMDLAKEQKTSYLNAVPTWKQSVELTCNALLK